jgi:N-acetylated-alpha-linked acidic dipeptidase
VFDNFAWFKKFADPDFVYVQQMARMYGLEILRLASADVLPYDYATYGAEVLKYIEEAQQKAEKRFGAGRLAFATAVSAAKQLQSSGEALSAAQKKASGNLTALNGALREAERALLIPEGLPNRPWFRHAIYAPGEYTGYAAVALPGVNAAIDKGDQERTQQQIAALAAALNRAAETLERAGRD